MNLEELGNLFILYGLNVLYAVGLLLAGWWLAAFVERIIGRGLRATGRVELTVASFLSSLAKYVVLVIVGVAVLQRFGIQTTSIIAVLGAASLAIGLALQGTLSNLAAGVMLLMFRPFRIGDAVEVAGRAGTVKGLSLFTTEIAAGDNVQVLIPNAQVWGSAIVNQSAYDVRKVELLVELKPDADIDAFMHDGLEFLKADPRTRTSPGPGAGVGKFAVDRVEVVLSGFAKAKDAAGLKTDLAKFVRQHLVAARTEPRATNYRTPAPAGTR